MTIYSLLGVPFKRSIFQLVATFTTATLIFSSTAFGVIIYDNGPLATGTTSRSGVAAPGGTQWSEVSHEFGSTTETNTIIGFGCQVIGTATNNRCADDFNVPVGQSWTINQVIVFAYQTGFAGTTSPVVGANVRIWNGRPGDAGATVIAGDTVNRLTASVDTLFYRTSNSGPPLNTVPGTTRRVWRNTITLASAAVLTAGNYWVDFQVDTGATTGNFTPPMTVTGTRSVPFANGRQFTTAWADALDTGNPATALDVPQEFAFLLEGSVSGAPLVPASRSLDFDGDNKTDLAIARSASAVSQTTWWIQNSGGSLTVTDFGLGVGFPSGDVPTPADFDGDGKTDIAVWRPGAALVARFYILNSGTSTVSTVQFGQTGDDTSVVDDFDGDGKADPACYRAGSNGTLFYRGSFNNPSGNISYIPWGTTGDIAIAGDFDGDGRGDASIMRNVSGNAQHWRRLSSGGVVGLTFGLASDKFVTGDFDADGRADLAAVRTNGSNFDWYILKSSTNSVVLEIYGNPATDYLVPGDYDGDNKTDLAVWRSGSGSGQGNFILRNTGSSPGWRKFGQSSVALSAPDYPVANWNVK